jgi:plasmid stabilization system protein ParE
VRVVVSPQARADLDDIWRWNAKDKGVDHADSYLAYLSEQISSLDKKHASGKKIDSRNLRYLLVQRRAGGHGHIVIYSLISNEIIVFHVFHTAQNWQMELSDED